MFFSTFGFQTVRSKSLIFDRHSKTHKFELKPITDWTPFGQIRPDPILTYVFLMVDDQHLMEIITFFQLFYKKIIDISMEY